MRAVIAEDDVMLRAGLERVLTDADIEVVAAVGDGEALVEAVDRHVPDVVVTDIRMPPTHRDEGSHAALRIRERHPGIGILLFSQHVESRHAVRLLRDHPRGIGYLLKDRLVDVDQFVEAVRRVASGGNVVDGDVVAGLLSRAAAESSLAVLSSREREVLGAVAEGLSNAAIAERLTLTSRTVETHVASVFAKLGLSASPDANRRVLAVIAHLRAV